MPRKGRAHTHEPNEGEISGEHEIPLSNSLLRARIDEADVPRVCQHRWRLNDNGYVVASLPRLNGKKRNLLLHRMVMGLTPGDGKQVDHINRDKLDNRRSNLRLASPQLNNLNRGLYATNSSGFKGVSFEKRVGKWEAYINFGRRKKFLGYFDSPEAAAAAYDEAAVQLHGDFASPNQAMPSFGGKHPHAPNQGKSTEWWTPPEVFESLGLHFDLDPCAPPEPGASWLPVAHRFTREDDGLSQDWNGRVWMNPPYGRETGVWMRKLAEHGDGIALVFARTDTAWWHAAVPKATAVCFIEGRLTFIAGAGQSAPGNSGGPSALIAYGDTCAKAIDNSGLGITYFTPPPKDNQEAAVALPVRSSP